HAFVKNIRRNGLLHEPDLLADSYGGKFNPAAGRELVSGLPTGLKGLARGKMTPQTALLHPHKAPKPATQVFDRIEGRDERIELNVYVSGYEDDDEPAATSSEPNATERAPDTASDSEEIGRAH